jgi:hypothetical protein
VSWLASPAPDGSSCPLDIATRFNVDKVTPMSCSATWLGSPTVTLTQQYAIHVELSNPVVSAAPTRGPDSNGWYNHPVTIAFSGRSFSGIASCTTATYSGPSTASTTVSGSCRDNAGKTVTATSAPFAYDAGPPVLGMNADTGDKITVLDWQMSDIAPSSGFELIRQPGLHGKRPSVLYKGLRTSFRDHRVDNGVRYQYTLQALDAAGNSATNTVVVKPGRRLLAPTPGAQMSTPPLLRWTSVHGASYYNVQLFRGKRKVLSMWPGSASLQLQTTWRFHRHRLHFAPGTYRWYVWPGYGKRSGAHYGHRIGSSTFVVAKTP